MGCSPSYEKVYNDKSELRVMRDIDTTDQRISIPCSVDNFRETGRFTCDFGENLDVFPRAKVIGTQTKYFGSYYYVRVQNPGKRRVIIEAGTVLGILICLDEPAPIILKK